MGRFYVLFVFTVLRSLLGADMHHGVCGRWEQIFSLFLGAKGLGMYCNCIILFDPWMDKRRKGVQNMEQTITFQALIQVGAIIMGAWGFFKVIMEIVKAINTRHDKEQAWDKAVEDFKNERENLRDEFNGRLDEQDAKNQQLLSMLCMTLRAQDAILGALVEQGIGNGEIKDMHKELKVFILDQVQ